MFNKIKNKIILTFMSFFLFSNKVLAEELDICELESGKKIGEYWNIILIALPFVLIILCTWDFVKAITSNDADALQKASTNCLKRVLYAIILMILPFIFNAIFGSWFKICIG